MTEDIKVGVEDSVLVVRLAMTPEAQEIYFGDPRMEVVTHSGKSISSTLFKILTFLQANPRLSNSRF